MSAAGIKNASALKFMIPCYGVVLAIVSSLIAAFIQVDQHINVRFYIHKIVPFVRSDPLFREEISRWVVPIYHFQPGFLYLRVAFEIGSHHVSVPGPFIFGIGCGVNARKSAAVLDKAFKSFLLGLIQYVSGCTQKNNSSIGTE